MARDDVGVKSLHVLVQSTDYACKHLEMRVESFLEGFASTLDELAEGEFQEAVEALAALKVRPLC
eukprot:1184425-Prorocentrum_minimum.AAC.3